MKKSYEEIEAIQSVASLETRLSLYCVLENIRSLYNVGSIFRTADGAGLSRLFLTGFTGFPPQKEIEKTALGATDFLPWQRYESTRECLQEFKQEATLIALEHSHRSVPYTEITLPPEKPVILVVGNEIEGIEEDTLQLCDLHTEIPMRGKKHSLNVAVAFGILIFHLTSLLRNG